MAERRKAEKEAAKMVERIAADMARDYLERWLRPALDAFRYAATGTNGFQFDPATNREFIKKFVPDAPRTINLDVVHSAELFYSQIMAEQAPVKQIEDTTDEAKRPIERRTIF